MSAVYTFNPMREFVNGHTEHVDTSFDEFIRSVGVIIFLDRGSNNLCFYVCRRHEKDYRDEHDFESRKDIFRQNMR